MNRELGARDIRLDEGGVRFEAPADYWGAGLGGRVCTLAPDEAQSLAMEILARWPLERCEPDTIEDWKADATRYLKDSNMLTRRFARRVVGLCEGFELAEVELAAQAAVRAELAAPAEPEKPGPPGPAEFLRACQDVAILAAKLAHSSNAGSAKFELDSHGYRVCIVASEKKPAAARGVTHCLGCHGRGYPCEVCKGEADSEGRCAYCHGES